MKRRILESESLPQRSPRKALGLAAAASIGVAILIGCGSPDDGAGADTPHTNASAKHGNSAAPSNGASVKGGVGSVGFDLQLGSATVDTGTYNIHGNGYEASGSIDLSKASLISVIVGGVPLGTGYTVTMDAHSAQVVGAGDAGVGDAQSAQGLRLTCNGSAMFDVTTTAVTSVTVPMECKEAFVAPPTVPVPRGAIAGLAALIAASGILLLGGASRQRRRPA